jgi:hypothetical protein
MIKKLENLVNKIIQASMIIGSFTFMSITFYSPYVLTSKSFKKIDYLNNEFSKLKSLEAKVYKDKSILIFDLNNVLEPEIFDKYYFLNDYLISSYLKNVYTPQKNTIEKVLLKDKSYELLTHKTYFNRDSLISDVKNIIKYDEYFSYYNYIDENTVYFYRLYPLESISLPDTLLDKLKKIKDISFNSQEKFEQEAKKIIGIHNYERYSPLITKVIDRTPTWHRILFIIIIAIFVFSIVFLIIISIISNRDIKNKDIQDLENDIDKAKEQIANNPDKVLPVWDLANYTLQKYYNRNLTQINSIFKLSIIVMLLGFILIVSIIIVSIFFKENIKLNDLGIIAGIITEFIGATFLFIYKSTMSQALQHTKNLEEINKVGMSIRIIESIEISDSNKEQINSAKIDISKKLINTSNKN